MALYDWPCVFEGPSASGTIRSVPEDFLVHEMLSFEPSGSGEHVFLHIEKIGENTEFVARQLARLAGVRVRDVGYAGLKDRHAITRQWFSVWLPGKPEPIWSEIESERIKVLQTTRHARKLVRGALAGNRFCVTVRDCRGDMAKTNVTLGLIRDNGIANYFGPQRFGLNGDNIEMARAMFRGMNIRREQRGLLLSSARSYLFNRILSCRVEQQTWNRAMPGDVLTIDGSGSNFVAPRLDADIDCRVKTGELHPTGVLWGHGDIRATGEALKIEKSVIDSNSELAEGLVLAKVGIGRRPLRVKVKQLEWQWLEAMQLRLTFGLPAGSYATAVLREIIDIQ